MTEAARTVLAAPWRIAEIELTASGEYPNPYTDVDVGAEFRHDDGTVLRRPAFHDGDSTWRIRFASPRLRHLAVAHGRLGGRRGAPRGDR